MSNAPSSGGGGPVCARVEGAYRGVVCEGGGGVWVLCVRVEGEYGCCV